MNLNQALQKLRTKYKEAETEADRKFYHKIATMLKDCYNNPRVIKRTKPQKSTLELVKETLL